MSAVLAVRPRVGGLYLPYLLLAFRLLLQTFSLMAMAVALPASQIDADMEDWGGFAEILGVIIRVHETSGVLFTWTSL